MKINDAAKAKYISKSAFIREAVAEKLDREQKATEAQDETIDWQKLLNQQN